MPYAQVRVPARTATLALCCTLTFLLPDRASGQNLRVTPDSGTAIRIWRRGAADWEQARFVRLAGDSLIVHPRRCCGVDTVPMSAVRALAVSTGRERKVSRIALWAAWGAVVGAGAGLVATHVGCSNGGGACAVGIVYFVPWFASGGAVVGGLIGSRKVDRWERIYPGNGAALLVVPQGGGRVDISVTLPLRR